MKVELLQASDISIAAVAARECYNSNVMSQVGQGSLHESDLKLLRRIILEFDPPHDSVIEHLVYTWRIEGISRSCSHQMVRHRIASYSQRSQRFVGESFFDYEVPEKIKPDKEAYLTFLDAMVSARKAYEALLSMQVSKEDARFVLPNACLTSLVVTLNARSLRNFLGLRLKKDAQWEIRNLALEMYRSLPLEHRFIFEKEVHGEE